MNRRMLRSCLRSHRPAGRSRPAAIGVCLALLTFLVGCEQLPDTKGAVGRDSRPEPAGVVSVRLWENLVVPQGYQTRRCEVGKVRRPALGCHRPELIFRGPLSRDAQGLLRIDQRRPRRLAGLPVLIETTVAADNFNGYLKLDPFLLSPTQNRMHAMLPTGVKEKGIAQTTLRGRVFAAERQTWATTPIFVPEGAKLVTWLAIEEEAAKVGSVGGRLRVSVESAGEHQVLIDEVIEPAVDEYWRESTVDLSEFENRTVTFLFDAEPVESGQATFSAPLFGSPMLVTRGFRPEPPNVIFVSLDTFRGDHLGTSRRGRALTPNLNAFAAEGALFTSAMTTYPSTTASHLSLLTGLYPARHNTDHPGRRLAREIPLAAQIFAAAGYVTGAVTENAMLSAAVGFVRGFDAYREERGIGLKMAQGSIEETFAAAIGYAEAHREDRFFLFVHTYQVHGPYRPPPEFDLFRQDLSTISAKGIRRKAVEQNNAYAGEMLYTDTIVGRFLAQLEELGLSDDTIVVITSDHGEEFGLHGHIGHSQLLWESVMHVPLMVRAPGRIPAGMRIEQVVSLVDVLPTVLELAGVSVGTNFDGISLVPRLEGHASTVPRAVFAENRRKGFESTAARTDTHRFLARKGATVPDRIFDVRKDPAEQSPISDEALREEGARWIARYRRSRAAGPTPADQDGFKGSIDVETAAKLKALGYVD
jgi:arylsulfatase A-like enzyme